MVRFLKRSVPLIIAVGLATGMAFLLRLIPGTAVPKKQSADGQSPALSVLGEMPDWTKLEVFQDTITRKDFERLLTTVFTTGKGWTSFIEINDTDAKILTGDAKSPTRFKLRFANPGHAKPSPHPWKTTADLPPAPPGKPLAGLRIAIDPGHLGGQWAQLEERYFVVKGGTPIREGDLTLTVAQLLKPRLENLGATVLLVRDKTEPVTPLRPQNLLAIAKDSGEAADSPTALQRLAERLFYRTAEIHARAQLVNRSLKPDLVLCLHFNADNWGDPHHPKLVKHSHFHLLVNGAYTDAEIAFADQRFSLLQKLLARTHEEEALVGAAIGDTFAALTHLPPYTYSAGSESALPVNGHPYLWARNLLANRLYQCPVIFMEPYVMNSTADSPRLQAGDYEGLRKINGKSQPSIFREYADSLTEALARHYAKVRGNQ